MKVKSKWRRKAAEHGVLVKVAYFELIMPPLLVICTFSVFLFSSTPNCLIGDLKIKAEEVDESQTRNSIHPVLINIPGGGT